MFLKPSVSCRVQVRLCESAAVGVQLWGCSCEGVTAGVRLWMLTGDKLSTALQIGANAGMYQKVRTQRRVGVVAWWRVGVVEG